MVHGHISFLAKRMQYVEHGHSTLKGPTETRPAQIIAHDGAAPRGDAMTLDRVRPPSCLEPGSEEDRWGTGFRPD